MKRTLAIFLSMAVLLCAVPHMVFAATTKEVDGITYELNDSDKTAKLTKGKNAREVAIPDKVNGEYTVTTIGDKAFEKFSDLQSVTIPEGVQTIGEYAFSCTVLTSITIPGSVTIIGEKAFHACSRLTSITILEGVQTIGDSAFDQSGLTSVTIPDSVTTIGEFVFYNCRSLTSVTIPDSVTTIGKRAFGICSQLTSISVDSNNKNFKVEDGVLLSKDDTRLVLCSKDKAGSYEIPNKVKSIDEYAFYYCIKLTSLTIPNSVTDVGISAFNYCSSLTSITIPNSVPAFSLYFFDGTKSLTSVTIPCNFDKSKFSSTYIQVGEGNTFTNSGGALGTFTLTHDLEEVEGKAADCVSDGQKVHYKCNGCKKLFSDADGKNIVTEDSLKLDKLGHDIKKIEKVESTCVKTGTKEHWECSRCHTLFSDENGETSVKEEDLTLPKLEHDWDAGEVTTAATLEKPGVKTYKCSRCGETKTEPVEYVSVPGGGNGDSTDLRPDAGGGDSNSSNLSSGAGSGDNNSTNSYSNAEPAVMAKRASIKTGDQLGIWVMFDMALLLISAYGVLVGVRSRRKRDRK